jgi:hypothetical protein
MTLPVLARIAGLLGGMCWVASAVTDEMDVSASVVDALHWGGLALIALSLIGLGAELVSSSAAWLRAIVAVCLPLLAWSVLEALRGELADRRVDGVFGLLLVLFCVVGLLRSRPRTRSVGTHAK